jgi:hypothetical protein
MYHQIRIPILYSIVTVEFPSDCLIKKSAQRIKIESHEQGRVMTFRFLQGKTSKATHGKLSGVLAEASVCLATVKRWCRVLQRRQLFSWWRILFWAFVQSHWGAISQFFSKDSFFSARILAKRLATNSHTVKDILTSDLGMRKFARRWMPMTWVTGIRDMSRWSADGVTGTEKRPKPELLTYYDWGWKLVRLQRWLADNICTRARWSCRKSVTDDRLEKVMCTIFFTAKRLLKLPYLSQE